jgi:hypothetical protein
MELLVALNVSDEPAVEAVNVPALAKLPAILKFWAPIIVTVAPLLIVKLRHTSLAFTVIENGEGIITFSVAKGACPSDQLAPVSQAPDEIAVFCAHPIKVHKSAANISKGFFIFNKFWNKLTGLFQG